MMAKKKTRLRKNKFETRSKQSKPADARETAMGQKRSAPKVNAKVKARPVKAISKPQRQHPSAGANRSEGIRLFALAGRPTKEQFVRVYGERGPKMTWDERTKAGVSARQFQAALAAKQ
jgi:hypothetical protein